MRAYHYTDLGNAQRFVAENTTKKGTPLIRYVTPFKRWLIWDLNQFIWVWDETGEIMRRAKLTVANISRDAAKKPDDKELRRHATRSESEARLRAMVSLAETEKGIPLLPNQLDSNPMLLNCPYRIVDLSTGKVRKPLPTDLCTKSTGVKYSAKAKCDRWKAFLQDITQGDNDLISFLQRAVGYSLTGRIDEQAFFLLHGNGANGKSTFLETIRAMMGDYATQADFETVLAQKNHMIRNDVARLAGARFVSAVEAESGRELSEVMIKQLTGGDTITARFLYKEFFEFVPQFKMFLASNHRPVIKENSRAIWRRVRLIPFNYQVSKENVKMKLLDDLKKELPGILLWAIEGCLEWQRNGLRWPTSVAEETEQYMYDMLELNVVARFIDECCELRDNGVASITELYHAYQHWSKANGEPSMLRKEFTQRLMEELSQKRLERRRSGRNGSTRWHGITLRIVGDAEPIPS